MSTSKDSEPFHKIARTSGKGGGLGWQPDDVCFVESVCGSCFERDNARGHPIKKIVGVGTN